MNVRSAVSSRLALQHFFARTDFVPSKTSISRRSRPDSAAPFKDSRPDTLAFMLSTLSTNPKRNDDESGIAAIRWRCRAGSDHPGVDFEVDHITKLAHAYFQGPGARLHELLAFSTQDFEADSRSMRQVALSFLGGMAFSFFRVSIMHPAGRSDERRCSESGPSIPGFRQPPE